MSRITTCLWFEKDGEAAARRYTSLVPNSRVTRLARAPSDYPGGEAGDVLTVEVELDGAAFLALNGGTKADYGTVASVVVLCDDQAEIDRLWDGLLADGGSELACGWVRDRWGVPWQVTPRRLMELNASADPAVAKAVFESMMTMVKIDLAAIERAAAEATA